ncbi:dienelactone hydrolase family protein [Halalkalibacter urbisdiaboli]|uniref:dienelactone hydrolase family protein n=1 Tax=Halalkalibacter urbisdiaboli TaxID=1960589 RepID=UPI000B4410C9|nr:alpha/beta hydrolase family protein [Halalkalibacter urbisdiaboli]
MWSPDLFMKEIYDGTIRTVETVDENSNRQLRKQFHRVLGEFPITQKDFDVEEIERVEFDDFTRIRIELTTFSSLRMPAYVLKPKDQSQSKRPAVLALHGHGYGSKEIVGLNPDGTDNLHEKPGIHKNFAVELVRRGHIVLAPEVIGFGERLLTRDENSEAPPNHNSCFGLASQLLLVGKTLAGLRVAECQRMIDYLTELPDVDSEKIGIMGLSGGGLVAAFTSAVDERIKATVICGYTNTFKGSIIDRSHCLDNYIPGVLQLGEMPRLIGLIAPRPLFIESGKDDHLFPIEEVKVAVEQLRNTYQAFEANDVLDTHYFSGGHEVSGEKSYDWLRDQLRA